MASTLIEKNRLSLEQVLSIKSKTPFFGEFSCQGKQTGSHRSYLSLEVDPK